MLLLLFTKVFTALYSHSATKFLFKKYIYLHLTKYFVFYECIHSHLRDVFIHIQDSTVYILSHSRSKLLQITFFCSSRSPTRMRTGLEHCRSKSESKHPNKARASYVSSHQVLSRVSKFNMANFELCSNKRTESRFRGIISILYCSKGRKMQIIPLKLDSVLLFLHNSKLAYYSP